MPPRYRRELQGARVTVPGEYDAGHVYHLFPVLSPNREALQRHLARGRHRDADSLSGADSPAAGAGVDRIPLNARLPIVSARRSLSLPMYPSLNDTAVTRVVAAVQRFDS